MAEVIELSDQEHLFEYARQMVRCDSEMESMAMRQDAKSFARIEGIDPSAMGEQHLQQDSWAAYREMGFLTEMVAGLTAQSRQERGKHWRPQLD